MTGKKENKEFSLLNVGNVRKPPAEEIFKIKAGTIIFDANFECGIYLFLTLFFNSKSPQILIF